MHKAIAQPLDVTICNSIQKEWMDKVMLQKQFGGFQCSSTFTIIGGEHTNISFSRLMTRHNKLHDLTAEIAKEISNPYSTDWGTYDLQDSNQDRGIREPMSQSRTSW